MSLLLVFAMVLPAALAVVLLWRATQGIPAIVRLLRVKPTPLRDVAAGPVEIEGTIVALDTPLVAPSGRAAVFADVVLRATRGEGKSTLLVHQSHTRRAAAAAVTAPDGTSVRLDFEHVEVVGAPSVFTVRTAHIEAPTRAWASAVGPEADRLAFGERIVEPGARVVISGEARVVDAIIDPRSSGYRDGVPLEKKTFTIGGTTDANLFIATGTARQLLWRACWPVAVLVMVGLAGLAYAGTILLLILA